LDVFRRWNNEIDGLRKEAKYFRRFFGYLNGSFCSERLDLEVKSLSKKRNERKKIIERIFR